MHKLRYPILLSIVLASLLWVVIANAQEPVLPTGTLVFNASAVGGQEIEVMPIGATEARNITGNEVGDLATSISPDGTTILFMSNRDGEFQLYTDNLEGSNLVQLTSGAGSSGSGDFSPDGSQIVFDSDRDGTSDLYVMDSTGENVTRLTNNEPREVIPVWSPDGEKIAYMEFVNSTQDETQGFSTLELTIGVIPATGGEPTSLVASMLFRSKNIVNEYYQWSPDSTAILYRSAAPDQDSELYTVDVVTGEVTQLTDNEVEESGFTWTDDQQIIFSSFGGFRSYDSGEDTQAYLYIMDRDGSNVREITAQSNVLNPIQNLVFVSETQQVIFDLWTPVSGGNVLDLWVVDLEGQNLTNITNTPDIAEGQYIYVPSGASASAPVSDDGSSEAGSTSPDATSASSDAGDVSGTSGLYTFISYTGDRDVSCGSANVPMGQAMDQLQTLELTFGDGELTFSSPAVPDSPPASAIETEPNIYQNSSSGGVMEIQVISETEVVVIYDFIMNLGTADCEAVTGTLTSTGTLSE